MSTPTPTLPAPSLARSRLSTALFAAMLLPVSGMVLAQQDAAQDEQNEPQAATKEKGKAKTLDKIVVTGSLIPTSQLETATPVTTISAEDIQARGFTSVADALKKSTFATGGVQNAQMSGTFTQSAETISLFGLSQSYVKYLIDGRPLVDYPALYNGTDAFNNISGIPIDLVDRIEILPGGQSSLYGSDAIAGVINIILKKKLDQAVLNVRGGWYSEGGGSSTRISLANGFSGADGRFNLVAGVQYEESDPIWGYQRDLTKQSFTKGTTSTGAASPPLASRDFLVFGFKNIAVDGFSNFGYSFQDPNNCANVTGLFKGTTDKRFRAGSGDYCGSFFSRGYTTLLNGKKSGQLYAHSTFDLNENAELYADVLYSHERDEYNVGSNFTFWGTSVKYGYYYDPDIDGLVNLQRAFAPEDMGPEGYRSTMSHDTSNAYAATFGAKGLFGENWEYDFSATRSEYKLDQTSWVRFADAINDYFDTHVLGPQIGVDPYGFGYAAFRPDYAAFYQPMSQQDFESFSGFATSHSKTSDTYGKAQVTNSALFGLPGGDAGLAVVLEGGRQTWEYLPDPGFLNGDIWGQTAVAGSGNRDRYAVTGELRMPVVSMLTATVSGRYDRYKTNEKSIGKSTYSLGLEFRPLDTLLFRGKYGTAFKAPTLPDLFQGQSGFFSFVPDYYNCSLLGFSPTDIDKCPARFNSVQYFGTTSGNPDLNPINADVWNAGVVWDPIQRLSLSADYFHYDITDEVAQQSANTLSLQDYRCRTGIENPTSALCLATFNQVTRNPAGAITSIFTPKVNVSNELLNVATAAAKYQVDIGNHGTLTLRGSYTQILKHDFKQYAEDPTIDLLDRPDFSTDPKRKADLSLGWNNDTYNTTLYANWFGKTPQFDASVANCVPGDRDAACSHELPSYITWNLSLGYQPLPQLQLSFVVTNLFNKMPPTDYTYSGNSGQPYNAANFSVYGRELYLQARYSFGANANQ